MILNDWNENLTLNEMPRLIGVSPQSNKKYLEIIYDDFGEPLTAENLDELINETHENLYKLIVLKIRLGKK